MCGSNPGESSTIKSLGKEEEGQDMGITHGEACTRELWGPTMLYLPSVVQYSW